MSQFADSIQLDVKTRTANLSEVKVYLIERLVRTWKDTYDQASSQSYRGNLKLERFLSDNERSVEDMSRNMKNITSYGMAEFMRAGNQK